MEVEASTGFAAEKVKPFEAGAVEVEPKEKPVEGVELDPDEPKAKPVLAADFFSSPPSVVFAGCPNEKPLEGAGAEVPPMELPNPNPVAFAPPNMLFSFSFGCNAAPKLN